MKGLLVIGHGSRSAHAVTEFEAVVNMVREKASHAQVAGAHMELASPDVPSTVSDMVAKGVTNITVVPYFLYMGNHIKQDIPEILDVEQLKYPHVAFQLAKPIGIEALMADILLKRAHEIE